MSGWDDFWDNVSHKASSWWNSSDKDCHPIGEGQGGVGGAPAGVDGKGNSCDPCQPDGMGMVPAKCIPDVPYDYSNDVSKAPDYDGPGARAQTDDERERAEKSKELKENLEHCEEKPYEAAEVCKRVYAPDGHAELGHEAPEGIEVPPNPALVE